MKDFMTVRDLRQAIDGIPDDMILLVRNTRIGLSRKVVDMVIERPQPNTGYRGSLIFVRSAPL